MSTFLIKKCSFPFNENIFSKEEIKKSFLNNLSYIKNVPFFSALENIALNMPLFIIAKFYSLEYSGFFSMVSYAVLAPISIISTSINQFLISSAKEHHETGQLKRVIRNIMIYIIPPCLCGSVVIILFGSELFTFVFGSQWDESGRIAQILIIPYAIRFLVNSISSTIIGIGHVKYMAKWQLFYFLFVTSVLFLSIYVKVPFYKFVIIFAIVDILAYFSYGYMIIRIIRKKECVI